MPGTLYTYPDNFRAHKILIAAQYSNNDVKVVENEPDFVLGETNKSEEFLKKFPLGKVPAYESGDVRLSETNAIAYYVGNAQTRGGDMESLVLEWIGFADNEILPSACTWVYPTQGIMQYNKQATEKAKASVQSVMEILNNYLATRTWLVGERVTQADISVACTLNMLYKHVMEPKFRESYGNVNRWFVTAVNQPQFKAVLGDVQLCEKMQQFDSKKFNEIQGKGGKKKAAPKTAEKKAKQPDQGGDTKKEEKPLPAAAAPPAKKVDPWSVLPKSDFIMDDWKKCYSNNEPDVYMPYFWKNFDKENYSIWFQEYKYNEEFTQVFMASNLTLGMSQRIDKMRKHTFGSSIVLVKDKKDIKICGVWFWKGQGLAFKLSNDWQVDSEHFNWTKLDPDCEETKKTVEKYFSWEGDFDGYEARDGTIFK